MCNRKWIKCSFVPVIRFSLKNYQKFSFEERCWLKMGTELLSFFSHPAGNIPGEARGVEEPQGSLPLCLAPGRRVDGVQLLAWRSHPSQAVRGSLKTVPGSVCVRAGTRGTPPLEDEEKRGGKVGRRLPF